MLEGFYRSATAIERVRACWLSPYIELYVRELVDRNIKQLTLRFYASQLTCFGEYLKLSGVSDVSLTPQWVEPFLQARYPQKPAYTNWRCVLLGFVRHLRTQGLVSPVEPPTSTCPHADILDCYLNFLREHRGIRQKHIQRTRRCCEAFLTFLAADGVTNLSSIPTRTIFQFITQEGLSYHRVTMSCRCGVLRRFLAHLYQRGVTQSNYSSVVVAPVIFRQEQCPRFLTRAEIEAVLSAIDQQTDHGRRDYAMILLLAVYGLRGIEARLLRLDDIDWRHQKLHIRNRKAGNQTSYPLSTSVGRAILNYLQHSRPQSKHREIFLTLTPVPRPIASSATLCRHVQSYLTKAGIKVARPGTHLFRYSCAQQLLDAGTPTKMISDFLGHQVPESTMRYTKIAINQLREVAIGDGEDLL